MKPTLVLVMALLLVVTAVVVAIPNPVQADKPQSIWCYRDVNDSFCFETHKECKTASDASITQDKCQKFP